MLSEGSRGRVAASVDDGGRAARLSGTIVAFRGAGSPGGSEAARDVASP